MANLFTTKVYAETFRDTEPPDLFTTKVYAETFRDTEPPDLFTTKVYAEVLRVADDEIYALQDIISVQPLVFIIT